MSDGVVTSFEAKLAAKLAKKASEQPEPAAPEIDYAADAPDVEYERDSEQAQIDQAIKEIDIVVAYNRWAGKSQVRPTAKREGIKVSCPNPNHPDRTPSAWLNRDKNTFYCGGCAEGGDIWDIAAYHFGFSVPSYKTDGSFRALRTMIAVDLGFTFVHGLTATYVVAPDNASLSEEVAPVGQSSQSSEPAQPESTEHAEPAEPTELATPEKLGLLPAAIAEQSTEEDYEAARRAPTIHWRKIIQQDTFLDSWMQAVTKDDCPEEFHLFTGLMALGFAVGRNVVLQDSPDVVANLYVCLVGPSGSGKSRAKRHLRDIITEVLPYDDNNVGFTTGTKIIGAAGSGEYLVGAFSAPIEDPANPRRILGYGSVRGYIDYEEFATLVAASSRMGATLKPQLMDIFDAHKLLSGGSQTHGKRVARDPFGQAISTTQNTSLSRLLSQGDDGSGFINRWIFPAGKPKAVRSWGGVAIDLTGPMAELKGVYLWGSMGKTVTMTPEALKVWDEFFHSKLYPAKIAAEKSGTAMLNRLDLLLKKLLLLWAINLKTTDITAEITEQVIQLYPYLLTTYGIVGKEIRRTEETDLGELILDAITRLKDANGTFPSKREIYHAVKRKFGSYEQLTKVLTALLKLDLIREEAYQPKLGRPTTRYAVSD